LGTGHLLFILSTRRQQPRSTPGQQLGTMGGCCAPAFGPDARHTRRSDPNRQLEVELAPRRFHSNYACIRGNRLAPASPRRDSRVTPPLRAPAARSRAETSAASAERQRTRPSYNCSLFLTTHSLTSLGSRRHENLTMRILRTVQHICGTRLLDCHGAYMLSARPRSLHGKLTILILIPSMGKLTLLIGLVKFSQLTYPVGNSCGELVGT
jgi:hypothetical protein